VSWSERENKLYYFSQTKATHFFFVNAAFYDAPGSTLVHLCAAFSGENAVAYFVSQTKNAAVNGRV